MSKFNAEKFGEETFTQISNFTFTELQEKVLKAVYDADEDFTDEDYFELAFFFAEHNGLNNGEPFFYNILVTEPSSEVWNKLDEAKPNGVERIGANLFQADGYEAYEAFYKIISKLRIGQDIYFYRGKTKDWENDNSWVNIAERHFAKRDA